METRHLVHVLTVAAAHAIVTDSTPLPPGATQLKSVVLASNKGGDGQQYGQLATRNGEVNVFATTVQAAGIAVAAWGETPVHQPLSGANHLYTEFVDDGLLDPGDYPYIVRIVYNIELTNG